MYDDPRVALQLRLVTIKVWYTGGLLWCWTVRGYLKDDPVPVFAQGVTYTPWGARRQVIRFIRRRGAVSAAQKEARDTASE